MISKKFSDENLATRKARRQRAYSANILSEMLLELMNEWKIEAADIHRATGIPYSTLTGYIKNHSKTQLLDGNILALSQYFNCSISYLAFGIGEDPVKPESSTPEFDQAARNQALRKKHEGLK